MSLIRAYLSAILISVVACRAADLERNEQDFLKSSRVPLIPTGDIKYCSFDKDDCNMDTYGQLNNTGFQITNQINYTLYDSFTDITSITGPTSNGLSCQIPYKIYETNYDWIYFCTLNLECRTSQGFAKCNTGRFLGGQLDKRNESRSLYIDLIYSGSMNINMYELNFYALMHCKYNQYCNTTDDMIRVRVLQGFTGIQVVTIKHSDFGGETRWKKFSVRLGNVYQNFGAWFDFIRDPNWMQTTVVYFAIDEIKISYSSDNPRRVTQCDFDETHCTVNWAYRNETYASLRNSLKTSTKTITDVSSTTKKAKNGEYCQIPFSVNGKEYFHCTETNECLTALGLSECAPGRFVGGMIDSSNRDSINIPINFNARSEFYKYGNFSVTFYTFMYCEGDRDACAANQDYLDFTAGYSTTSFANKTFQLSDYKDAKDWIKTTIDFEIEPYYKLELYFKLTRKTPSNATTFFGIDEIEVVYLDELDPDTTTTRRPDTTSGKSRPSSSFHAIFAVGLLYLLIYYSEI